MKIAHHICLSMALLTGAAHTQAQEANYPSKPIRLIVPFATGGAANNNMRLIGQKLGERLGQSVVIDNKPGAGGTVALNLARQAPKDGYTLLYTSVSNAVTAARADAPYDLYKDFSPVIQTNAGPLIFYVRPDSPIQSMKDLVQEIKRHPGKLNYGSIGMGSGPHMAMEKFKLLNSLDITHVPYKSSAESSLAVISGIIQIGIDPLSAVVPLLSSGKVRPLAVTSARSAASYPAVPGMVAAGFPDFEFISWAGVSVLPGTPEPVIRKLNTELNEVLKDPAVVEAYRVQAAEVAGGTPEQYGQFIRKEVDALRRVLTAGGIVLN